MDDATKEHNLKARKDAVNEALEQLYQLDVLIARAVETHVKLHREMKSDIKKRLKDDYQMPAAVVQARYASYKLERQAQDSDDEATLDIIREMFDALPVGGMVDMVTAAERAEAAE